MKLQEYISQALIDIAESITFETDVVLDIGVFVCRDQNGEIICVDENSNNRVKFTVHITPKKESE